MKTLFWIGKSLDDVREFPEATRGAGAREIRIRTGDGAFRVFYVVESGDAVYVLHAFQKKSQKTSASDIAKGKARYRLIP